MLLSEMPVHGARAVAEEIQQHVESGSIRRAGSKERITNVTISSGVTESAKNLSLVSLIEHADMALCTSKNTGRNKTSVYGQA